MTKKLLLAMTLIVFGMTTTANALTDEELTAIGNLLTPSNEAYQENTEQPTPELPGPQKDIQIEKKPSALEIFYRLGQVKEKTRPSDPARYERQIREFDHRIKNLFSKEESDD